MPIISALSLGVVKATAQSFLIWLSARLAYSCSQSSGSCVCKLADSMSYLVADDQAFWPIWNCPHHRFRTSKHGQNGPSFSSHAWNGLDSIYRRPAGVSKSSGGRRRLSVQFAGKGCRSAAACHVRKPGVIKVARRQHASIVCRQSGSGQPGKIDRALLQRFCKRRVQQCLLVCEVRIKAAMGKANGGHDIGDAKTVKPLFSEQFGCRFNDGFARLRAVLLGVSCHVLLSFRYWAWGFNLAVDSLYDAYHIKAIDSEGWLR